MYDSPERVSPLLRMTSSSLEVFPLRIFFSSDGVALISAPTRSQTLTVFVDAGLRMNAFASSRLRQVFVATSPPTSFVERNVPSEYAMILFPL